MASDPKRSEVVAEIDKLQGQQVESITDATFVGWSRDHEAAHQKRTDCIKALLLELDALDATQNSCSKNQLCAS